VLSGFFSLEALYKGVDSLGELLAGDAADIDRAIDLRLGFE